MGKKRKAGRRRDLADERFEAGPLEFARFGRITMGRNRMNTAQHAEMMRRAAENYPTVVADIQALVDRIVDRVAGLPPDLLLHQSWMKFAMAQIMGGEDADAGRNDGIDLRMIDYVQSVIAAAAPRLPYANEVSEEEFATLRADVEALFHKLAREFPIARTAHRKAADPELDMALEAFQVKAEMIWAGVRGARFQVHEKEALQSLLEPHSEVLERLFGLGAEGVATEADRIQTALARGLHDAFGDMELFRDETLNLMEAAIRDGAVPDGEHPMAVVMRDAEIAEKGRDVFGRFMGMDLFDVEKTSNLPDRLRNALSWSPGEEATFLAQGDDRGWPLRVWPTMKRPFIRIGDRTFCFDRYALFDNLYRAVQRIVLELEPGYRVAWNEGQQRISEELPFRRLEQLLPQAAVFRPVYYNWAPDGGRAQWHEADGVLAYDGHLFIIEIKGGAFTWTSPTTDLPAHLASLRALVASPAKQGTRFLDYLESRPEVPLYDEGHAEVGRLRLADYRHVSLLAVTLDPFTELAARAQHLPSVGVDVGARPVWVLSVDDLLMLTDLFANPLDVLHFTEQRMRAAASKHVDVDDEMDHIGLYLRENRYSEYAEGLARNGGVPRFNGYSEPIYTYYAGVQREENPPRPRQDRPPLFDDILALLSRKGEARRSELAGLLLDMVPESKTEMAEAVVRALADQPFQRRSKPLSLYGESPITLFVWTPSALRDAARARQHAEEVAAAVGEASRVLLELQFGPGDTLVNLHWARIGLHGLAAAERMDLNFRGGRLARRRVRAAVQEGGALGRNVLCPCGSGQKYKRCHGLASL